MTELYIHHFGEYRVCLGAKSLHTQKERNPAEVLFRFRDVFYIQWTSFLTVVYYLSINPLLAVIQRYKIIASISAMLH